MELEQQLRDKARELLETKAVQCVIGYERATDGITARPLFAYEPDETARFIWDETCNHNLANYLVNRKGKRTALVAKPCDSRAINLLLNENQIKREEIVIIGMVCSGMKEGRFNEIGESLQHRCQRCHQHTPPVYDVLLGEPGEEGEGQPDDYADVAELESRDIADRRAFWLEQAGRCIRCYACRQACPGCYCIDCFAETLDPLWVGIRIAPAEKQMWNLMRAYHLAGRCIACNECERVCPMRIPLSLLNRKLEKEVFETFSFRSGMDSETPAPLAAFNKNDDIPEIG